MSTQTTVDGTPGTTTSEQSAGTTSRPSTKILTPTHIYVEQCSIDSAELEESDAESIASATMASTQGSAVSALLQAAAAAAAASTGLSPPSNTQRWSANTLESMAGGGTRPANFSDDDENDEVVDANGSGLIDGRCFIETVRDDDDESDCVEQRYRNIDAGREHVYSLFGSNSPVLSNFGIDDEASHAGTNRNENQEDTSRLAPDTSSYTSNRRLSAASIFSYTGAGSVVSNLSVSSLVQSAAAVQGSTTASLLEASIQEGSSTAGKARRKYHAHGYHPAELVHFSIYYPELNDSSKLDKDSLTAEELDQQVELCERRQVLYYYEKAERLKSDAAKNTTTLFHTDTEQNTHRDDNTTNVNHDSVENTANATLEFQQQEEKKAWDMRLRKIGLAQALVNFCSSYSDAPLLNNVHSQRHRWVLLQPEPGFWILAEIALGRHVRPTRNHRDKVEVEYVETSVDDECAREIILEGYRAFRLCYGRFIDQLTQHGRDVFCQQLAVHFEPLVLRWHFDRPDIHTALNGIHFAPLSRTSRMAVEQMLSNTRTRLSQVRHTMLLWDHRLVSTDLEDATEANTLWQLLSRYFVTGQTLLEMKSKAKEVHKSDGKSNGSQTEQKQSSETSYGSSIWGTLSLLRTITPSFLFGASSPQVNTQAEEGTQAQTEAETKDTEDADATSKTTTEETTTEQESEQPTDVPATTMDLQENKDPESLPNIPRFMVPIPVPEVTGRFLTGAVHLGASNSRGKTGSMDDGLEEQIDPPPIIYLGEHAEPHHLVLYQCPPHLLLAIMIPLSSAPQLTSLEFYRALYEHVAIPAEAVNYRMYQERHSVECLYKSKVKNYRFVHFDLKTRAIRTTILSRKMRSDVRECLLKMHDTFLRNPDTRELCDRLCTSGRWVLGRRDSRREVYFIIDRKDATLVQVEEEFRRFSAIDIGQVVSDR